MYTVSKISSATSSRSSFDGAEQEIINSNCNLQGAVFYQFCALQTFVLCGNQTNFNSCAIKCKYRNGNNRLNVRKWTLRKVLIYLEHTPEGLRKMYRANIQRPSKQAPYFNPLSVQSSNTDPSIIGGSSNTYNPVGKCVWSTNYDIRNGINDSQKTWKFETEIFRSELALKFLGVGKTLRHCICQTRKKVKPNAVRYC